MTVLRLPVKQEGAQFSFLTELDGVTYSIELRWNARDDAWFLDFGDGEGEAILSGIKILVNVPLLNGYRDALGRLPTGTLMAIDTAGTNAEAGYADLGRRVVLLYIPDGESLD